METYVERHDKLRVNAVGDMVNKQFFLTAKLAHCMTRMKKSTASSMFLRT